MFDRFIRLARARKSLRDGRFVDALREASDPVVEADRRAEQVRARASAGILARAARSLERGDVAAAKRAAQHLQQWQPGAEVEDLLARCDAALAASAEAMAARRATAKELRELLDAGALRRAEAMVAAMPAAAGDAEAMRAELATRRRRAATLLAEAAGCAEQARSEAAIEAYVQSLAVDDSPVDAAHAATRRRIAEALLAEVAGALRDGDESTKGLLTALDSFGAAVRRVPALRGEQAARRLGDELRAAATRQLRGSGSLEEAARLGRALRDVDLSLDDRADQALAALLALAARQREPDGCGQALLGPLAQVAATARAAGFEGLARTAAAASAAADGLDQQFAAARELLERGDLGLARERFVAILAEDPLHADAAQELEMLDGALADLDRRLADARTALRSGRLREARALAMSLAGTPRIAAEAQLLAKEARDRMELVDKGIDEVRVALHGRASSTIEGVRHSLGRLRELERVQEDHEQLPAMVAALQVEITGLERCTSLLTSLAGGDLEPAVSGVPELVAARASLLHVERIDARLCEVGDGVQQHGERALAAGRLAELSRAAALLACLEVVRPAFGARAAAWREERASRERRVAALLTDARGRCASGDPEGAAVALEEARELWRESDEVRALAAALRRTQRQESTLAEAAAMARDEDFAGAQQKLAAIADVDPSLRTRVFDIQRDLVRAQGLEGPFLLRVDEGGEHLVVRGETLTLGNVRHGRADLPILANLAGRHASIRRSMSFHGGMEDVVVAEEGEVQIRGQQVERRALAAGDVVQLGPALGFRYERPTARSLSSRLVLLGGFRVAGTDRLLLMKDRGRDGRLLVGAGQDLHVPVPGASGEVAIYAHSSGQMRVACDSGGTIDGVPFTGEHPLAAGEVVEAAGVTMVLMPWTHPGGASDG